MTPSPVDAAPVAVSCGLAGAPKCGLGQACSSSVMCLSANCTANRCAAASCTDGKRDGDETGLDCGGSCAEKCDGEACTISAGCKSRSCVSGKCAPSGTKVCGVGTNALCAIGAECSVSADCSSDVCSQNGSCEAPWTDVHRDGARNAGETGVDCGGSVALAQPCAAGQACNSSNDCEGVCPSGGGVCAAASATDAKKNQGETDVDCGGPNAPTCSLGKACGASSDCTLKYCSVTKTCAVPTSTDGIQNGAETDIDCGGGAVTEGAQNYIAPRCDNAKICRVDADCNGVVCGENLRCAEAPSCRPIHGGQTCGVGEYGVAGSVHESCCRSLPVPGLSVMQGGVAKQVYLDKYEITAGRVRAWLAGIRLQYAGQPDVQAWIAARISGTSGDKLLATYFPKIDPGSATGLTYVDYLPKQNIDQLARNADGTTRLFKVDPTQFSSRTSEFYRALDAGGSLYPPTAQCPDANNCYVTRDMGLFHQVGPTSYLRGALSAGTSGCGMYAGGQGHRTYEDRDPAFQPYFREPARDARYRDVRDEKSANCMPPPMFAAFCAWDGGYVMSRQALAAAYGTQQWPWGNAPDPWTLGLNNERDMPGNFNWNVNSQPFTMTRRPAYNFPDMGDGAWTTDFSSLIAAPGRFTGDIASVTRPGVESWMDLGGNFIEWSFEATGGSGYWGWTGSSWEGHVYPGPERVVDGVVKFAGGWKSGLNILDKYGKGGSRCMRLR